MTTDNDVKVERLLVIKEVLLKLIENHKTCNNSTRLDWLEKKIDALLEELKI